MKGSKERYLLGKNTHNMRIQTLPRIVCFWTFYVSASAFIVCSFTETCWEIVVDPSHVDHMTQIVVQDYIAVLNK